MIEDGKPATGTAARLYDTCLRLAVRYERFLRFLVVGAVNTVFGYTVFALLYLATHYQNLSVIIATICGVIFNYFTTGRLVFGNKSWRTLVPFILAYGVALGANLLVLNVLLLAGVGPLIGQAVSLPVVVIVSYLINSKFVFRARPASE